MRRKHLAAAALAVGIVLFLLGSGAAGHTTRIGRIIPAAELDQAFHPVRPTDTFGAMDTFFVAVELTDYQPDVALTARWLYQGQLITETPLNTTMIGSGFAGFSLTNQKPPWPAGRYSVEILIDGRPQGQADYQVRP